MVYTLKEVEYRYQNPLYLPTGLSESHRAVYEQIPPLVSSLHSLYRSIGLVLQKMLVTNYPHQYLGQVSQINLETVPENWMGEGRIKELLTLSPKTLELKYSTQNIIPPFKYHPQKPIAKVTPKGVLQPYTMGLSIPTEQQDASCDFIRVLDSSTELNRSLMIVLAGFTLSSMQNSTIAVNTNNPRTHLASFNAIISDENIGIVSRPLLPYYI